MSRLPYRNRTLCRAAGRQPWWSPRRTCKKIQIVTIVFSSYSPKAKAGALRPPQKIPFLQISRADYPPRPPALSRLFGTCRVAQVVQCAGSDLHIQWLHQFRAKEHQTCRGMQAHTGAAGLKTVKEL